MKNDYYIRKISGSSAEQVLEDIGFDKAYIHKALNKYNFSLYKIHNLKCPQASILKQLALSVGADAAVHREVITCGIDSTDVLIGCTKSQLVNLCEKLKFQPFKLNNIALCLLEQIQDNKKTLKIRDRSFNWGYNTYIMGILNITPDSFSDGGCYEPVENAILHFNRMVSEGADIIDIGGESTRPYSQEVPAEEELKRVMPVIKEIRKINKSIPISIDTRHSIVARQAIEAGADIINDVSGFKWDTDMIKAASEYEVPVVTMHSLGNPDQMQINPEYAENVIDSISKSLYDNCNWLINNGIKGNNIIIDPGIGFGKKIEHNLEIIKRIEEFKSLGFPVLVGVSRKSFINSIIKSDMNDIEDANIALASYLAEHGVDIIRVHYVKKHYNALKVMNKIFY